MYCLFLSEKRNIYILITFNNNYMDVLPQLGVSTKKTIVHDLDLRDKKILFMLSQNVRTPLSKIAKFANLSRDSIKYRIKGYENKGIIKESVTVVNATKLGYDAYHIFLRLNNPSKEAESKMIKEITEMPFVRAILKFFGNYDFEIAVIAKTVREFDNILSQIIQSAKSFIQDYEILVITNNYRVGPFPKSFLDGINTDSVRQENKKITKETVIPDKKDLEIIKIIRTDARLPLIDIASKVHLSPDAVNYRLKKLSENIIISFSPVINYQPIGYTVHALLLNITSLDSEKERRLKEFVSKDKNIFWAVKTVGRYNVLAYIGTKNETDLQDTIKSLRSQFPEDINRYETLLAFEQYKYIYAPDCLFENI